ncbi:MULTISPECIES: DUF3631 domain-containing protein [unclassified Streptomyces]|uniref:DUF3631 domain-containing protein n=1 Tax=unclassified Streptomyces TaxID=2593676 RepID=UPI00224E8F26|nr:MULTISPECIES: DUF3631 domain-containing protein [unclassified Streptomyces]MCX5123692.1 DUF3631 domain-containing protein [Streptomyces sp. NBC_00347]MCX5405753.1 DUF3631 domain-containing protein [Streptomyces sp. NBC_00086]
MTESTPSTPSHSTAPTAWPAVAVPGQPGAHLHDEEDGQPSAAIQSPAEPGPPAAPAIPASEGAAILDELRATIRRYVVMPSEEALTAATLWAAATHLQAVWQHAPRLAVVGPAKRCGKSRLLEVLIEAVHDPLITVNASAAAIFRSIGDANPPTLLVDEVDTIFGSAKVAEKNEEMRGLLNAGHQRNRPTLRVSGPNHDVQKFSTFAMAALAGIGDLPDTIMDRSVVIRMRRRAGGEKVTAWRYGRDDLTVRALRERLAAWLASVRDEAIALEPKLPVDDRAADTWEPLISVADLAGGRWPLIARTACKAMTDYESGRDQDGGLKIRILTDIRKAFASVGNPPALRTADLLNLLNEDPEAPWAEISSGGLTPLKLRALLTDYGISSGNRRFPGGNQAKGFTLAQFTDAWTRYCPPERPAPEAAPATGA